MEKVIHYVRVSTDEQADKGYSLRDQEDKLARHSTEKGCEVVAIYREDFSAKAFDNRPEFQKLLNFVKKNRGEVHKLKFVRWDRFSRNATDALVMIRDLERYGVSVEAIDQPLDLTVPESRILLMIYVATPQVENDRRSLNTKMGMRRAKLEGRWCTTAPFGYRFSRDERNKPILIKDGHKAELVKTCFEMYASGLYDKMEVLRLMRPQGMTLERNRFTQLFHNCLYAGRIVVEAHGKEPEQIVTGVHVPIIDLELFEKVQDVAGGKRHVLSKPKTVKEELPLRGFLVCPTCGGNLTGSASRGKSGKRFYYYHCQPGCKTRFNATEANQLFEEWLRQISLKPEHVQSYMKAVESVYATNEGDRRAEIRSITEEIKRVEACILKTGKCFVEGSIDEDVYRTLNASYKEELAGLKAKKGDVETANADLVGQLEFAFDVMSNLHKLWAELDLDGKRTLVSSIFSGKLIFENDTYRTPEGEKNLSELFRIDKAFGELEKEKAPKIGSLSRMVARTGIEPVSHP